MTLARNTFEGQTSGTNLTVANSGGGSGDALNTVSPSNTTAMVFSTVQAKRGTTSLKVNSPAGTAHIIGIVRTANDAMASAVDVYFTAWPTTATTTLLAHRITGSPSVSIGLQTNGRFVISNGAGVIIATSTATAPLNQWVHLDLRQVRGTGTADGTIAWDVNSGGTSIFNGNLTNVDAGTAQLIEARTGKVTAGAVLADTWFDDFTVDDGRTSLIGAAPANAAPTVNAGADKTTTVGTAVQIAGTASGTVTYAWTLLSALGGAAATLTGATTSTLTVTPTAGGVLTYRLTATDTTSGASGTDDVIVYVQTATIRAIAVTANLGGYTVTGAADIITALSDSSASTYAVSPDSPSSPAEIRLRLAPLLPGTGWSLTLDNQLSTAGSGTATVTLYEGSTVRKVWTPSPSSVVASAVLTLTDVELAAIGSTNTLDLALAWNV